MSQSASADQPHVVAPEMSVVVTVVDGGATLKRFLQAMLAQRDAPTMEILVPFDATATGMEALMEALAGMDPRVRWLPMGVVSTARPITTAAGQHELYDRRRGAGLRAAIGSRLIAILEDRAPPRPDWAATMVRLHASHPYGVIGGAIECDSPDDLNWAFHACDFGRFARPFESGPRAFVSDVNVCYKRPVIQSVRHLWSERFNEVEVHWTLTERGETLFLSNEPVVDYRTPYTSLLRLLPERFGWGRLFGHVRAKHFGLAERVRLIITGPLIPLVLFVRHARVQKAKGNFSRFVRASPTILALLVGWTSGEVWGYITNRP